MMAKYLRYLVVDPEPSVLAVLRENTNHLCWMFEHYATPYPTGNVAKVNVWFTADAEPVTAHEERLGISEAERAHLASWRRLLTTPAECLGIAEVREFFDVARYPSLSAAEQQRYYLDRLHTALVRCARQFGWDESGLADARDRMLADGLRFAFLWKKPLRSPDRCTKVQGFVEAGPRTHVGLVFLDGTGKEIRRSLLSIRSTASFDLRFIFGQITWIDNQTVRVTQDNGRDYWLCTIAGQMEFHYPRAEGGDASGEFALGRMYYGSTVVLGDRERGLRLISSAASKGDKHALAFLGRLQREAGSAVAKGAE